MKKSLLLASVLTLLGGRSALANGPCGANEHLKQTYAESPYTVGEGQTSYTCDTLADCEPQCLGDPNCAGYSEDKGLSIVKFAGSWDQSNFRWAENVLFSDGSVKCWAHADRGSTCGSDESGVEYDPADPSKWATTKLSGPAVDITRFSDGNTDMGGCAVMQDGTLECWLKASRTINLVFVNPTTNGDVGDSATNSMENHRLVDTGALRFRNITSSKKHFCGILKGELDGQVACFGGGLIGTAVPSNAATPVDFGSPAKQISCGDQHCCVLLEDNTLRCFGSNAHGQLGYGDTTDRSLSDTLPTVDLGSHVPAKVAGVVVGTMVVTTTGDLIGWGNNQYGQLGYDSGQNNIGDDAGEMGTNLVTIASDVKDVNGRVSNMVGILKNDGNFYITLWFGSLMRHSGSNVRIATSATYKYYYHVQNDGQYSVTSKNPTPEYSPIHIKNMGLQCNACSEGTYNRAGDTTEGTCDDGEVCNENFYSDGSACQACPEATNNVAGDAVADGPSYCTRDQGCAQDEIVDENLECSVCPFGTFSDAGTVDYSSAGCQGQAGTCAEDEYSKASYVANNKKYTGATCSDCQTECTSDPTCLGYTGSSKIISVISTRGYTCAASDQGVKCWGKNNDHGLGIGQPTSTVVSREDAVLKPMAGVKALRTSFGTARNPVFAVMHDGTARCWGYSFAYCGYSVSTDVTVPGPNIYSHGGKIKDIRTYRSESMMLLEDGRVFAWGYDFAQTRNYETNSPLDLGGLATAIAVGSGFYCAVIEEKVKCWGNYVAGQGVGSSTLSADLPFLKGLPKPVVDIQAGGGSGGASACALFNDGTVKCWGSRSSFISGGSGTVGGAEGEMEAEPFIDISGVVELSSGETHYCARLDTGGLKCFGYSLNHRTGDGLTEMTFGAPVDRIFSGRANNFVGIDGNVKSFGYNSAYNMLGHSSGTDSVAVSNAAFAFPPEEISDGTYGATTSDGIGMAKRTACTTCPEGTTKAAGDSLATTTVCAGMVECGDTEYYAANKCYCRADHHLVNGVCMPCSGGGRRAAGDDKEAEQNTQCAVCEDYQHFADGECKDDAAYTTCNCASAACPESGALFFAIGTPAADNSECRQPTWTESKIGQAAPKPKTRTSIKTLFSTLTSNQEQVSADRATKRNNFKSIVKYVKLQVQELPDQRIKIPKESMVLSTTFLEKLGQREEIDLVLPKTKTPSKLSNPTQACEEKDVDLSNQLAPYDVPLDDGEISLLCKGDEPVTKLEKLTSGATAFNYACWQNGAWQAEQGVNHDENYQCGDLSFYVNSLSGITCAVTPPVSQSDASIVAGTNADCGASLSEGDTCTAQCGTNYVKVSDGQCTSDGYQAGVCSCNAPFEINDDGECRLCDIGSFSVNGSACQPWTVTAKQCNYQGKLFVPGGETFDASCGGACPAGKEPVVSYCAEITNEIGCETLSNLYGSNNCCEGMEQPAECLQTIDEKGKQHADSLASLRRADDSLCQEGDSIIYQNGQFVCTA